ncbi:hypothetical protein GOP47_0029929 [Adiantum capillus-veneris]|nr:hypothetical protein GOP47_0029929 [Adiantum capillus-veneris]
MSTSMCPRIIINRIEVKRLAGEAIHRRSGSSGMSWTDTWCFNEEGELVRKPKEEQGQLQRFAGSSLSRIHDSTIIQDEEIPEEQPTFHTCPASSSSSASILERSKSVGSSHVLPRTKHQQKPSSSFFKWIKKTLHKMKK